MANYALEAQQSREISPAGNTDTEPTPLQLVGYSGNDGLTRLVENSPGTDQAPGLTLVNAPAGELSEPTEKDLEDGQEYAPVGEVIEPENPGMKRAEDPRNAIRRKLYEAIRENQEPFRESIELADRHLEQEYQRYNREMNQGGLSGRAVEAKRRLTESHGDIQKSLDQVPQHQKEMVGQAAFAYLLAAGDEGTRDSIVSALRSQGFGDMADRLEAFKKVEDETAPDLDRERQLKSDLDRAATASITLRTEYLTMLNSAVQTGLAPPDEVDRDNREITELTRSANTIVEKYGPLVQDDPVVLELDTRSPAVRRGEVPEEEA